MGAEPSPARWVALSGAPTYAFPALPPHRVEGDLTGTSKGLARMLRAIALTLTCAALALTAAACGESASGGDADPASLVPAGTPLYFQAAIQPSDARRDDALAA